MTETGARKPRDPTDDTLDDLIALAKALRVALRLSSRTSDDSVFLSQLSLWIKSLEDEDNA